MPRIRLTASAIALVCACFGFALHGHASETTPMRGHLVGDHAHHAAADWHPDDVVKRDEHAAFLRLAPAADATHVARQSGRWSEPGTWLSNSLPEAGARVHIPAGVVVLIDADLSGQALEWVRVGGILKMSDTQSSALKVTTLAVDPEGELVIGAPDARVRADVTATIAITPRKSRDTVRDPIDLAGGLISHGSVQMYGALKTAYVRPAETLRRGVTWISSPEAVSGWRVGDRLLVPGVAPGRVEDEEVVIAEISADGRRVRFEPALQFDHLAPEDRMIPVSNLTRNINVYSTDASSLQARGHAMFMHQQTGTVIDSVAFRDLGRTDTRIAQTIPLTDERGALKPGTDSNTIGRYAVHFHVRSGASIDIAPHVVRNSVIIGSPKHGLVNHGAHVVAENNIGFRNAGSHFFAENGSEIGTFVGNVAVRSTGSGDTIRARDMTYDFGHQGHGFWSQSGGVHMADNYAFGHHGGAYVIFGYPFIEHGRTVFFDAANAGNPDYADSLGQILISNVNFTFENNTAAGSAAGLEIWNHKIYGNHDERSRVDGFTAWGVANFGIFLPYVRNVDLRKLKLYGDAAVAGASGLSGNTLTENLTVEDADIRGFDVGVAMPRRGDNLLAGGVLANKLNVQLASANKPGRLAVIRDVDFRSSAEVRLIGETRSLNQRLRGALRSVADTIRGRNARMDISLRDQVLPENGDIAMLFEKDLVLLSQGGNTRQLFFASQLPDQVVLKDEGPTALHGLSARDVYDRFGIAVGGALAPRTVQKLAFSDAWSARVGDVAPSSGAMVDSKAAEELYPMASKHFVRASGSVAERWQMVEDQSHKIVFVDKEPPKFHFLPGLRPFEIHPDDIQYGYRIMGMVADRVGSRIAVRAFAKEFSDLKQDSDGFVRVQFTVADMAGNETTEKVALRVTDKAVRRGANINFFVQDAYCGKCGYDTLYTDIAQMFDAKGEVTFAVQ